MQRTSQIPITKVLGPFIQLESQQGMERLLLPLASPISMGFGVKRLLPEASLATQLQQPLAVVGGSGGHSGIRSQTCRQTDIATGTSSSGGELGAVA